MPARTLINSRPIPARAPQPMEAVLRARVSSKDQEKEGFSIPAQVRLLREYASNRGIFVAEEFVDAESSKKSDGDGFTRMVQYLKKHRACRAILVEKTDRLYRNPKDWVTIDELGVEIHFVKENRVLSQDSRPSEKLAHGMNVVMAKHYIDNLSEETLKGMTEKARSGFYPSFAPFGYLNADGPGSRRILLPDSDTAPVISELFKRFAAGAYSIRSLVKELNQEGVSLRGAHLRSSVVHQILRKRMYMGDFDWNAVTYQGNHEPLVTPACWQRVQELLDARAQNKARKVKHDFPFKGLVSCGHCGCLMVGELKKARYVYYHCTGNRGKCPEPYTRQEVLTTEFAAILRGLVIPQPVLDWLGDAVLESDRTEHAARQQSVVRLQTQHDRIEARIRAMYLDKLDGRVAQDFYDE
jgi:site-specific DNA recombinase